MAKKICHEFVFNLFLIVRDSRIEEKIYIFLAVVIVLIVFIIFINWYCSLILLILFIIGIIIGSHLITKQYALFLSTYHW